MEITKEQFLTTYNKFPPDGWSKFAFKYFSKSTVNEDAWLKRLVQSFLAFLFLIGFIGTIAEWGENIVGLVTLTFMVVLIVVGIIMSVGAVLNNLRVKKIRKELGGVSKYDYNKMVDKYF